MKPRIGVLGIGLAAYWPQFTGLRERLEGYQRGLEARLADLGADIVSAGLVDTAEGARAAGDRLAAAHVKLIMLYTATYATSSQVQTAGRRQNFHRAGPESSRRMFTLGCRPVCSRRLPSADLIRVLDGADADPDVG